MSRSAALGAAVEIRRLSDTSLAHTEPNRYGGVFNNLKGWRRVTRWLCALTAAAVIGLVLADASDYTVGIVAVIGLSLAVVANKFVIAASYNERMRRFFDQ